MIFLIEYNPRSGERITYRKYDDSERRTAYDERLRIELDLNQRGIRHEVVILEAENEAAVRRTHQRYFESLEETLRSTIEELKKRPFPNGGDCATQKSS